MRIIQKPTITPIFAYTACYSSFKSQDIRDKFNTISAFIGSQSTLYDQNASSGSLYIFKPHRIVFNPISKEEMVNLYEKNMVQNQAGRKIYDELKSLAPLNKCPFCGVGQVSTLDHYLPKDKFPTFAVLPYNLVACCSDCNKGKLSSYSTSQDSQVLHPYYDDFTQEQWLFAKVLQPLKVEFYVVPPLCWNQINKDRVKAHFESYKLQSKFSNETLTALAYLKASFELRNNNVQDIIRELELQFNTHKNLHLNSWETAMYQALYQDLWYCSGGFLTV
jgi:hypothetical protein